MSEYIKTPALKDLSEQKIVFLDKNLEEAIRETLEKPGGPLTRLDLHQLETFVADYRIVDDLSGLKKKQTLSTLSVDGNSIVDLTPLQKFIHLTDDNFSNKAFAETLKFFSLKRILDNSLSIAKLDEITPECVYLIFKDSSML